MNKTGNLNASIIQQYFPSTYTDACKQIQERDEAYVLQRDIGAYNSCLNECKYCYANRKPEIPKNVIKLHDEQSPLLLGHIKEDDNLIETKVIIYIEPNQTTLFNY